MKSKKILTTLVFASLIVACSSQKDANKTDETNTTFKDAYAQINQEDVMSFSSQADILLNYGNSQTMYEFATHVAIARIDSIDGGSNLNEVTGEYCYPYTYGKMTILEVYKGDLSINQEVDYVRMGGIISFDDYYKSLSETEKSKIEDNLDKQPDYMKMKFGEDIDIEAGKTYLVYLNTHEDENINICKEGAYPITGLEGGLREIDGNPKTKANLNVYNNITKQWESIDDVIKR